MSPFDKKIEEYFGKQLGWGSVTVRESKRLAGGISRETWKVALEITGVDGVISVRDIVLRVDPMVSVLESNRRIEAAMFRAFEDVAGVPVPEVICNEDDPRYLGSTFMAVAALPGTATIAEVTQAPYREVGPQIARAHFRVSGTIAAADYRGKQLEQVLKVPAPESAASDALAHWEGVLREKSIGPTPITEAAVRYLRRHLPPPPARVAVVHGDFRLGNCLYLPDGTISGVLDWEMAHLGDPLEDLAWALLPDYRPSVAPDKVAGHISESEAIRLWEEASGLRVDPEALHWWRLFCSVKHFAIFTTGAYGFLNSGQGDPILALMAWSVLDSDEGRMIDLMGVRA